METNFKITIPMPCHEDWNNMNTTATGRFCGSCTKNVVDFTAMIPIEIKQYFTANKEENICGRFKNEQLENIIIEVPSSILHHQMSFRKAFLLALFVVMGTTLFSCKNINGETQTIGKVAIIKDTVDLSKDELIGKIDVNSLDSVHHYYKNLAPPQVEKIKFIKPNKNNTKTVQKVKIDTINQYEIMGKLAQPEIMGEPATENPQK